MGYWKHVEANELDRPTRTPGRFVSAACFEDDALRRVVEANLSSTECSYSGLKGRKPIAAPLDTVVDHIFEALSRCYEDATNGVGWEGGFVGATTWDTYELVDETVVLAGNASPDLLLDISEALPSQVWSYIDPYGARGDEVLSWSWEAFCETVKHRRRYFFLDEPGGRRTNDERISPGELLAAVARGCETYGLLRTLPSGQRFFRCRSRSLGERFTKPKDLGPPPARRASQSRMSPAGITMFYGAMQKSTARAETLSSMHAPHAMAEFQTTRSITVLDLTQPPWVSLFDEERAELYDWARFMRGFLNDFRQPVERDGSEHIDYVPTQVVTEYFRAAVTHGGQQLDGVLYQSARAGGGPCVVLFAGPDDVAPNASVGTTPRGVSHLLVMRGVKNAGWVRPGIAWRKGTRAVPRRPLR